MGDQVAEGSTFMVSGEWWDRLLPRRRADGRGILLQPPGRRLRDIVDPQRET